jgi:hypothetical protein
MDHPDLVAPLINFADLLRTIGQDTEAADLEAQAVAIRSNLTDENVSK